MKLTIILGVLVSLGTLAGTAKAFWPTIGWTTPERHVADYQATEAFIKEFRDEWKCDEYDETLHDLLQAQRDGDDSLETERSIEKLRDRMDDLDCQRFEDFG